MARGEAPAGDPGARGARDQAIREARQNALETALANMVGPIDRAASRRVLDASEAWTGAYRVLELTNNGEGVVVMVEVDIDTARLRKRVELRSETSTRPRYRLARVNAADACGIDKPAVQGELMALGAVSAERDAIPVTLELGCDVLGPVSYAHLQVARVRAQLSGPSSELDTFTMVGFGVEADAAVADAMAQTVDRIGEHLARRRHGQMWIRVEAGSPAAAVRRLERVLRDTVRGVDRVAVERVDAGGEVWLRVEGRASARQVADELEMLSRPGFSPTIVARGDDDELTLRLGG